MSTETLERCQGSSGTSRHGNVFTVSELQVVAYAPRSTSAVVQAGRDPNDFDIWPSQQHGQRAGIVGVSTEVGIE